MNESIKFSSEDYAEYTLIRFVIMGEIISPSDLRNMQGYPDLVSENKAQKGVIISGRGPIWLHAYLAHYYHPCSWVAIYDPRLRGGIVVQSHKKEIKAGDIIPLT